MVVAFNSMLLSSAFLPTSIPNLTLWLDGNDPNANGIRPPNGAALATWHDKSTGGNNFLQSGGSTQPIFTTNVYNNLGSLVSSGNKFMQSPFNANLNGASVTMLCASKPVNNGNFMGAFTSRSGSGGFSTGYNIYAANGGTPNWQGWTGDHSVSWSVATDGNIDFTKSAIISVRITGGIATWYVNGVSFGTTNYTPSNGIQQFVLSSENGSFVYQGTINEVLVYNAAITDIQLSNATNYLINRWGA